MGQKKLQVCLHDHAGANAHSRAHSHVYERNITHAHPQAGAVLVYKNERHLKLPSSFLLSSVNAHIPSMMAEHAEDQ